LSASERLKRKKAGLSVDNAGNKQMVSDLTELANRLLSRTGNMDIYQETYEYIQNQVCGVLFPRKLLDYMNKLGIRLFSGEKNN